MLTTKLKPLSLSLLLLSAVSSPVLSQGNANNNELIKKISARTETLENEIKVLRKELASLKKQPKQKQAVVATPVPTYRPVQGPTSRNADRTHALATLPTYAGLQEPANDLTSGKPDLSALLYLGGTPVVVSPYLGERSAFDGSDLIVNIPPVNLDKRILLQWQKLENVYRKCNLPVPNRPFVDLSGKVEGQVIWSKPYTGRKHTDIDLSATEAEILAQVNNWVAGYMSFKYDNSQINPPRTSNSRIFLNKGFAVVGDLDLAPLYGTIGQAYVPFGVYASNMLSAPLTQLLGRTKARYVGVGYSQANGNNLYGSVYTFKGDSGTTSNSNRINQGGINLGFKYVNGGWNADVGAGYIASVTDSEGMQATGGSSNGFTGFGATSAAEKLHRQIPGIDVYGSVGYGQFALIAEYLTAADKFAIANMSFNNHGAKPSALNVEGSYSFKVLSKPTSFSIGYQQSREALALLLPKNRYIATLNTSIWKSTIASLEYRHDVNYGRSDSAFGQNLAVITNGDLGHSSDTVTAQFGVYF